MTEASTIMPTNSKSSARSVTKSRPQAKPAPVEAGATGLASGTASSFTIGDRVTHHMFGDGTVDAVRDHKLRIKFETVGSKEILSSFITRPR
jgi:DNA helicase II / ATP-dependent DNA helicase PcrA